jgi:hypothetical protein
VHSLFLVYLYLQSLHVLGDYRPIIRRNNCVYVALATCYCKIVGWIFLGGNSSERLLQPSYTPHCVGRSQQTFTSYQEKFNLLFYSNEYQVLHKHNCFPKHKYKCTKYTKNKLCTKLVLFTRNWCLLLSYKFNADVLEGKDIKKRRGEKWVKTPPSLFWGGGGGSVNITNL